MDFIVRWIAICYDAAMGQTKELLVTLKPGFTTISPDRSTVVSFDREGRLFSYVTDGTTYRRSLASTVEVRWQEKGQRQRRRLARDEVIDLFAEAYTVAQSVYSLANTALQDRLNKEILSWNPHRLLAEQERFAQVYKPVSILPPDQYLSIVLQATEGCTWNRCTFCNFYQDRPFRAKSLEEFSVHIRDVVEFFGRGAWMRKGIFLADGNALALSLNRLEPILVQTRSAFPQQSIYSFIDVYTGERKTVEEWSHLVNLGLERVYIGMETGLDELLHFLNKPGSQEELIQFVHDLKKAGLAVGLIVMVGVGGAEYRQRHATTTIEAIRKMPLSRGDLVYLSPFIEQPGSTYVKRRKEAGLTPLESHEIEQELSQLAGQVRALGIKAARYDIREFIY